MRFALIITTWLVIAQVTDAQPFLPLQPKKLAMANEKHHDAIATHDSILLADAYYDYGKIYKAASDYTTAQRWYLKALRILASRGDSYLVARVYLRLSDIEDALGHRPESLRYASVALQVSQRARSARGIALAYGVISRELASRWATSQNPTKTNPLYDTVWHYYTYIKQYHQRLNDTLGLAEINTSMGDLLLTAHDRRGFAYMKESWQAYQQLKRPYAQVGLMQLMAKAHIRFGEPDQAWPLLKQAERLYARTEVRLDYTDRHFVETYIGYYKAKGDYRHATEQLEKLQTIARHEAETDRAGAISRLNVEYETEKKEALLKSQQTKLTLNAQNRRVQQWFLVAVSALFLLATVASVVFFRLYRQNQRISQRNAELVREQNHRVKNNLQVLSSLLSLQANRIENNAARQAIEDSQLRVETMALLQRRLYDGDRLAMVSLSEFIPDLVATVLQTFGYDQVETRFNLIPVELNADAALRIGLIVNELTTNACKYAFADHPAPVLTLSVASENRHLTVSVADNGPGLPEKYRAAPGRAAPAPLTFGLRLVQMQVAQLNGSYCFDNEQGAHFSMRFPN